MTPKTRPAARGKPDSSSNDHPRGFGGTFEAFAGHSESPRPKHAQLSERIRSAIKTGVFKPGDKLPTEVELLELTPFSLGTIQRAIRSLADAGLIQRRPRLGTFVADQRRQINKPWHFRFLDEGGTSSLPVFPRVVSRQRTAQRGPWSAYLGHDEDDMIRIDRLVNVNDEFLAYSRFFVRGKKFFGLLKYSLKQLHAANFRMLLENEYGVKVGHISHKVSLGPPPASAIGDRIRLSPQTACMCVEILASSLSGEPLYYQELTIPPSNRKLFLASTDLADY